MTSIINVEMRGRFLAGARNDKAMVGVAGGSEAICQANRFGSSSPKKSGVIPNVVLSIRDEVRNLSLSVPD